MSVARKWSGKRTGKMNPWEHFPGVEQDVTFPRKEICCPIKAEGFLTLRKIWFDFSLGQKASFVNGRMRFG